MKPADFGRLLASSSARGVIQNRELVPFAEVFSSTTTAGTFSMKAQGAMAWEMVRYALGWNRARRSWIALWCSLKYPHACSSSLSCACHSALRSPSRRCFVEMLFVSQRALQRTYRRAGTLRSMDCVGSRCCIRLMMRLAVRLEVIGLSASRMSQGEHLRDVTGLVFGQTGLSQLAPGMAPGR